MKAQRIDWQRVLWVLGDRIVTIVETRPDQWRVMDTGTGELSRQAWDGTTLPDLLATLDQQDNQPTKGVGQ